MNPYRTEVFVPAGGFVSLQLPKDWPEGLATIAIRVGGADERVVFAEDGDPDTEDIEWWDEFEEDLGSDTL